MPKDYKLFWQYVKDNCDHAGIWKPNVTGFNRLQECDVNLKTALEFFNGDKERIVVLKNGRWNLLGFIEFQYGKRLNAKNRVHKSVLKILEENEVNLTPTRPQLDLTQGLKDKDKDKEKDKDKIQSKADLDSIEKEFPYLVDSVFKESFQGYLEMRKKLRKTATKKAEGMALTELHKHPILIAIKMLDQSIMRSWVGIFPLKDEQQLVVKPDFKNYDKIIEARLCNIATKDMIKKVMLEVPENLWWKVDSYLKKRYPGGGNGFGEAERDIRNDQRNNIFKVQELTVGIGDEKRTETNAVR